MYLVIEHPVMSYIQLGLEFSDLPLVLPDKIFVNVGLRFQFFDAINQVCTPKRKQFFSVFTHFSSSCLLNHSLTTITYTTI
jgi:hypothetical protein